MSVGRRGRRGARVNHCGMWMPRWLAEIPAPLRHVVAGAVVVGAPGALAGLVIGLITHPPTAWFAVFELGLPAAIAGGVLGLIVSTAVAAVRRARGGSRA